MAPEVLERALQCLPADPLSVGRLLTGSTSHEDAAIVVVPGGKALVQTVDFFTPIVNDPYKFGQIAAANALSDVYAMGGEPWCAMNIVCFPSQSMDIEVLSAILRGGADKTREAGAALAGGHTVEDPEIKYGLSVTGLVDPLSFARNTALEPGQTLVVTKALGTGILATAVKGQWPGHEEMEDIIFTSASRLNAASGQVIRKLGLKAATDITGFGLGGHLLEMLDASGVAASIHAGALPVLPHALELAAVGMVPAGSHANRAYRKNSYTLQGAVDPLRVDVLFDAQTSGGMVLAVPANMVADALAMLADVGETTAVIGETQPLVPGCAPLLVFS